MHQKVCPRDCSVLIVDANFFCSARNADGTFQLRPSKLRESSSIHSDSRHLCDVDFIQELLNTYDQVAVLSGSSALQWALSQAGNSKRSTMILIDLDDAEGTSSTPPREARQDSMTNTEQNGIHMPNYAKSFTTPPLSSFRFSTAAATATPPQSPKGAAQDGPYGIELLKAFDFYIRSGILPNVYLVAMSRSKEPEFMSSIISSGASSYLVKPVSIQTMHGLWLNVNTARSRRHALQQKGPHTSGLPPTSEKRNPQFETEFLSQFLPSMLSVEQSQNDELEPISEEEEANLRKALMEWAFNPYNFTHTQLLHIAIIMINESISLVGLSIPYEVVKSFVLTLSTTYYDNKYHNFHHAIDVTQCTYYTLHSLGLFNPRRRSSMPAHEQRRFNIQKILKPIDVLALIIASLSHDAGHPGLNNIFMVKAQTQLAELYNDQSVLENFHASCFSMLMQRFISQLKGRFPDFKHEQIRKIATHSILATDMARHYEFIEKCKAQYKRFQSPSNFPLTPQQEEVERLQICATVLKCADISNIVRTFSVSQSWTVRLEGELNGQADLERVMGLKPSIKIDTTKTASNQVMFYTKFGLPLFSAVSMLLPELSFMEKQLRSNILSWKDIDRQSIDVHKLQQDRVKIPTPLANNFLSVKNKDGCDEGELALKYRKSADTLGRCVSMTHIVSHDKHTKSDFDPANVMSDEDFLRRRESISSNVYE
ncbi:3',5'-cyclic-nucleotide phosphodiesterase [Mycoemilia scoparia]|uniref:3',5'-cyclic-nucleotide phosphodiesterase n=1 Tax=Mycoemilia scoparia TaxID=417184 RepID=A0A9W8A087_9FUNG|nr:3',5'-cyclic-nucleotide phosphodiesterase [Mycoemilia scoparia]